jgi:hypothetical protein
MYLFARFVVFCFQWDEGVVSDEAALADHGPEARNGNAAVGNIKKSRTNNRWLSGKDRFRHPTGRL